MLKECFIVATGASLKNFDFSLLEDNDVIAVNYAYQYVTSKYIVAIDKKFHIKNHLSLDDTFNYTNIDFEDKEIFHIHKLINNSGFTALLLAVFKLEYNKINLLGYDHKWEYYQHFYPEKKTLPGEYAVDLKYYNIFERAGIEIINYSDISLIPQFKKKPLFDLQQRLLYEKMWNKFETDKIKIHEVK